MKDRFDRKASKLRGRKRLKKHFKTYFLICIIASIIGTKYTSALYAFSQYRTQNADVSSDYKNVVELQLTDAFSQLILNGNIDSNLENDIEGQFLLNKEEEKKLSQENPTILFNHLEIGKTDGIFAQIYKIILTKSFLNTVIFGVYKLCNSMEFAILIVAIFAVAIVLTIWIFFINIFRVIMTRFFLEGRIYDYIPARRASFLMGTKTWGKASMTMLLLSVYKALWNFTIIGGIIKYFSYFAVPYILSENPSANSKEAITLSRKMMNGHKKECFVLMLSFWGWGILNVLTIGLFGLFYLNAYREAVYSEFYAEIRKQAVKKRLDNTFLLKDNFLFKKASDQILQEKYEKYKNKKRNYDYEAESKGIVGFLKNKLGITWDYEMDNIQHIKDLENDEKLMDVEKILSKKQYPWLLFPIKDSFSEEKSKSFYPCRKYSVKSLLLIFAVSSFIGWFWEVSFHLVSTGKFVNRGFLHGPWLPIYGVGGLIILTLLYSLRKKPLVEFLSAIILCGIVEYGTGWYLETVKGCRWWDYSGYFLNVDGRICAEGLLLFGLGGMFIVYFMAPLLDNIFRSLNKKFITILCILLVVLFSADFIYSSCYPNMGKGVTTTHNIEKELTRD